MATYDPVTGLPQATTTLANVTNATASTYAPTTGTASSGTATDWTVDPNSTVEGRMTGLLSQNSDYMKLAQTGAKQQANASGLLNSSMAAGAGQVAAIQSAMPIAQQDASTYANAGQFNAQNRTQNSQFNANLGQDMTKTNLGYQNQAGQWNAGNLTDVSKFNAGQTTQNNQFNASNQNQTSQFNADAAKQTYMQSAQFQQDKAMFGEQSALQKYMQSNEFAQQINMQASQFAQQSLMQSQQFLQDKAMFGEQSALQKLLQSNEFAQARDMFTLDENLKKWLTTEDATLKTALTNMDTAAKTTLAGIEADYKTLIQTSASAQDLYGSTMDQIAKIMADPNIPAAGKTSSINGYIDWMKQSMNLVSSINGVALNGLNPDGSEWSLLDFSNVSVT